MPNRMGCSNGPCARIRPKRWPRLPCRRGTSRTQIGDRPERVEAREHLQDGEGHQEKEGEREIPEVVLVIDSVPDEGPADEIPAEQLHEHDRRARYGRQAVIARSAPAPARGSWRERGGRRYRAAAGVGDPAPDEEGKQREQQHPVRRQHAPGDLEGSRDQQDDNGEQQQARARWPPPRQGSAPVGRRGPGTPAMRSRGPAATV